LSQAKGESELQAESRRQRSCGWWADRTSTLHNRGRQLTGCRPLV